MLCVLKLLVAIVAVGGRLSAADRKPDSFPLPVTFERGIKPKEFIGHVHSRWVRVVENEISVQDPAQGMAVIRLSSTGHAPWALMDPLPGYSRYLVGNPKKWRSAQHHARLERALHPGIKAILHGSADGLEYDFVIQPGASIGQIQLSFPNATVRIAGDGSLIAEGPQGRTRHKPPVSYQEIDGERRIVPSRYRLNAKGDVGFEVDHYDATRPITVDPVLAFLQNLGGSGSDMANAVTTDMEGNIYVAGSTYSVDFPRSGSSTHVPSATRSDGFVTKLDPQGKTVLYSVYFGGNDSDQVAAMQVDASGFAYVTGVTSSTDFPTTPGAFRGPGMQGPFAYVLKIDSTGTPSYSTILSRAGIYDGPSAIAVNSAGEAYIAGVAFDDFPVTPGAYQTIPVQGTNQGFIAHLDSGGTKLLYGSFLAGGQPRAITLDSAGDAYVAGNTGFPNSFPTTPGAVQSVIKGATDAFVLKLNPAGSALVFSTLLGGAAGDSAYGIVLNAQGAVYVTGGCELGSNADPANPFPITSNAALHDFRAGAGFLTKLDPAGTTIIYSTYLESSNSGYDASGVALTIAADGSAWVAGRGYRAYGFAETDYGPTVSVQGTLLQHFSPDGSALLASKFFPLIGAGFRFDGRDSLLIAGYQGPPVLASSGNPTLGPGGTQDVTIAKIGFEEGTSTLQVDATYLTYNRLPSPDGTNRLATKTITLTSSGEPLNFHIATPVINFGNSNYTPVSVSQTDGTTPASVDITVDPLGFPTGEPTALEIVSPGSAEPVTILPIRLNNLSVQMRISQSPQLIVDSTGTATATMDISAIAAMPWNTEEVAVPFRILPVGGSLPSWLTFSPDHGVTPATITLTGSSKGLTSSPVAQFAVAGPGSGARVTSVISLSITPGLVIRGGPLTFSFANASGEQTQLVGVDSSAGPLQFSIQSGVPWVRMSASSNVTPAVLSITVDASLLTPGQFTTFAAVRANNTDYLVKLSVSVGPTPPPATLNIFQRSIYGHSQLSPGAVAKVFGPVKLPEGVTSVVAPTPLPTVLGGYRVTINGAPVPIISVSSGTIDVQIPYEAAPGYVNLALQDASGKVIAALNSVRIIAENLTVVNDYGTVVKADGTPVGASNAVEPGDVILVRYTGQGPLNPPVATGDVPALGSVPVPILPMSATIGGKNAEIVKAGMSATVPGILEAFLRVPDLAPDDYYARLEIGDTLSESAALRIQKPSVVSIQPAANGATYITGGLVPGSWAQVKGTSLSAVTRIWNDSDFEGLANRLPTNLSGVEVRVNGIPASVYYISPSQISFQVPDGIPTGSGVSGSDLAYVSVQAFRDGVASNVVSSTSSVSSPAIFPIIVNNKNYPAGVFLDGKITGDPGVSPAFRKARAGDVIQLYVTGLTASAAGIRPDAKGYDGVMVKIRDLTFRADAAVLVAVGEFQINLTVPQQVAAWPEGDYPLSIQFTSNGVLYSSPPLINSNVAGPIVLPIGR